MIRACECMPSLGELTSTRCPGCNFCSMRTRAPWALTFSVNDLSLSLVSSCRQTSTLSVLAIRFSDRPFDIIFLPHVRAWLPSLSLAVKRRETATSQQVISLVRPSTRLIYCSQQFASWRKRLLLQRRRQLQRPCVPES